MIYSRTIGPFTQKVLQIKHQKMWTFSNQCNWTLQIESAIRDIPAWGNLAAKIHKLWSLLKEKSKYFRKIFKLLKVCVRTWEAAAAQNDCSIFYALPLNMVTLRSRFISYRLLLPIILKEKNISTTWSKHITHENRFNYVSRWPRGY